MTLDGPLGSFFVAAVLIGILVLFIRPNSPGPRYVTDVANALASLARAASGQDMPAGGGRSPGPVQGGPMSAATNPYPGGLSGRP